jgi:hypothetical protein
MGLTNKKQNEGTMWVESIVSSTTHEGVVQFRYARDEGEPFDWQLSVDEARDHALKILECCEAADSDAALFHFYRKLGAAEPQAAEKAAHMLQAWRAFRAERAAAKH